MLRWLEVDEIWILCFQPAQIRHFHFLSSQIRFSVKLWQNIEKQEHTGEPWVTGEEGKRGGRLRLIAEKRADLALCSSVARAAAARVLCLQLPLLSTLSSHSPRQRLETQVYRTISLPCLISEIGSSDTRANVNESFEEMRNQRRRDWWRKSMLPPFFFQRLLIVCFLTSQPHTHIWVTAAPILLFF